MVTREDLESFLIRMDLEWRRVDDGMYLVQGRNSGLPMVVHHADNLLLIRLKVMDMPETAPAEAEACIARCSSSTPRTSSTARTASRTAS
jgi:hypothetical protein